MQQDKIRNIAIIAHVDHGKTTLVDALFRQSGLFRENQTVSERLMDSMDQERERGITIAAKNGGFAYGEHWINILDTPGHADFGGQVERVLHMADSALLLVDAAEGPMPQTTFVLKKALALGLPILLVINKIDKPASRCDWVVDQVFDLMVRLGAPDELLDFPVIYACARDGMAKAELDDTSENMQPLFEKILSFCPAPKGDSDAPLQMLISSLSYSSFLGRLSIGKITSGSLKMNQDVLLASPGQESSKGRITKIYRFTGNNMDATEDTVICGEVVAVAGLEEVSVGQTITDPNSPLPLEAPPLDPPTISMNFIPNDSPFSGREGQFVTSRHIKERLDREVLSDIALTVEELTDGNGYKVSGRGELHLSVLIEKMRRESYEFQVTRPQVIYKEEDGKRLEPYEELIVDIPEDTMGSVMEMLSTRKGLMIDMQHEGDQRRLKYKIPTRGLLGFRGDFLTETRGEGLMNYVFLEYGAYAGDIKYRKNGALIAMENGTTVAYALCNIQERGVLFLGPGIDVYMGQILGQNSREGDLVINPSKGKKLTNMRASGSDDSVVLTPAKQLTLEDCLAFINDDELVEVTPSSIRLRKTLLDETDRKRASRK